MFGRVQGCCRKLVAIRCAWKICRGEPRNLANWPAEFRKNCCGKLYSLMKMMMMMCTVGMASLLISEDEPEDVQPTDYTLLSTTVVKPGQRDDTRPEYTRQRDETRPEFTRQRQSTSDVTSEPSRRRHTLLPRMLTLLCLVSLKTTNFSPFSHLFPLHSYFYSKLFCTVSRQQFVMQTIFFAFF